MKFDEWFEEQENYSLRCDRFIDLLDQYAKGEPVLPDIEEWLRAAYNQGYFHAISQTMDDGK